VAEYVVLVEIKGKRGNVSMSDEFQVMNHWWFLILHDFGFFSLPDSHKWEVQKCGAPRDVGWRLRAIILGDILQPLYGLRDRPRTRPH
jgi:hypothetical protein